MIYNLMDKARKAQAEACGDAGKLARLEASNDLDRWRKKFFLVFSRERGTLDISQTPSLPLVLQNLSLNPTATTRVGDRILKSNWRFWAVFVHAAAERLNDFSKATLRARLFGGSFAQSEDLRREIGSLIDVEKLLSEQGDSTLPVFGGSHD